MKGTKVEITYKVVTPMFLSGSENQTQIELRPPSIKGALRFWYRAIDSNFRKHEQRIFGSSDKGFGQSLFLLQIKKAKINKHKAIDMTGYDYLGYGVIGEKARYYIKPDSTFTLRLLFKPNATPDDINKVKRSLWAMTMFGGLGARSRKGFGSIIATSTENMDDLPALCPENTVELQESLQAFIKTHIKQDNSKLPEHSCWSPEARCIIFGNNNLQSGVDSLKELQRVIFKYRSSQSKNCFPWAIKDKDSLRKFAQTENSPNEPPKRSAFGLPHNYYFGDLRERKYVETNLMDGNTVSRRGSPLFFKVYQFPDKSMCIIATFLKSRFVPKDKPITITAYKKVNGHKVDEIKVQLENKNNYQAITDLLNKLASETHQGMEII